MTKEKLLIPVSISNRHIHLTEGDVNILFGKNYKLTKRNDLKQKGQFAAMECIAVLGPKGEFKKVRIVGPTRAYTQFELSQTDSIILGIDAPVSYAGKAKSAGNVSLVGPYGQVERSCAVIASRHLHLSEEDSLLFDLKNEDVVSLKIDNPRGLIFENIVVRVDKDFVTEIHLDTDDGNFAGISKGTVGELIKK